MKLTLSKLVKRNNGLFLPNIPEYKFLQITSAKINDARLEKLEDFLNAPNKENFPFGLTLELKIINPINFFTAQIRIPNPQNIAYFLGISGVGHYSGLENKKVYLHHSFCSQLYGITFPELI